jgi:hypothetical protein
MCATPGVSWRTVIVMTRALLVIWLLVVGVGQADAKMMVHYDLAGLLVQSEAVVIAERIGPAPADGASRYRVTRSLRGGLKPGAELELYDGHYNTRGRTIEPRAVLFLSTHDGKPHLVPSGLRVIEKGKVFRFEQHDNPGPYVMVPQLRDPQDQWGLGGTQLDLVGLEAAITAAGRRVDGLAAATALTDPAKRRAAMLALFTRGSPGGGFYVDVLANRAEAALAAAGDLEGALMIDLRDRGLSFVNPEYAKPAELLAIAKDPSKAIEIRVAALEVARRGFGLSNDHASVRAAAALIDDPAPQVRAAAIATAVGPARVTTSDRDQQRKLDALAVEIRGSLAKRYAIEQDPRVVAAIIAAYQDSLNKPLPPRASGPRFVATATLSDSSLGADVYCVRPSRITDSELIAKVGGARYKPAFNVTVHCNGSASTGGLADGTTLPTGTYELIVELTIAGSPKVELSIGTLVVHASGERELR